MKKERKTYRMISTGKAYLKYGLDAKWRKMERYDVIEEAVEKLAQYEDMEETIDRLEVPDNGHEEMYKKHVEILEGMINDLRAAILGENYIRIVEKNTCDTLDANRMIIDSIIQKYKECNEERRLYKLEVLGLQLKLADYETESFFDKIKRIFRKKWRKCKRFFRRWFDNLRD